MLVANKIKIKWKHLKKTIIKILPYFTVKKLNDKSGEKKQLYLTNGIPDIYNANGEKMQMWYLNSPTSAHVGCEYTSKVLWDKYNYALKVRFFCDDSILIPVNHQGHHDYAWLREAESIIPDVYSYLLKHPEILKGYKIVFTHNEKILSTFDNSRLALNAVMWYGTRKQAGGELIADRYLTKKKNISMICSNKNKCYMHGLRHMVAKRYINSHEVDVYGTIEGGIDLPQKSIALDDYRYQIVIENEECQFSFTEKILDCFGAQVIPIYCGASRIGDYFNLGGIITINKDELCNISNVIEKCNENDYLSRKNAIIDNYNRSLKYKSQYEVLFETYKSVLFN